jgi:hypothetical protein
MTIVDDSQAMVELERLALPNECPVLLAAEVMDILTRYQRGALWSTATVVQLGSRVIPTLAKRNGHRFKAVEYVSGTSNQQTGATEPTWTTTRDGRVTDGSVIWQEDGWDWDAVLWDLDGAACEAWQTKAGKTINRVDFETQSIGVSASQMHEHCLAMARRFQRSMCL